MQRIRSGRWIGDRRFYQRLLRIALPIMLQSGITNLVSLLDNIMVGAVGTESMTEAEKGQASDSFKRACFNLGIGRELYTAPQIFVTLTKDDLNQQNKVKTRFYVKSIGYHEGEISALEIIDNKGKLRFSYGAPDKEGVIAKVKTAKTVEELTKLFNSNKPLQADGDFIEALKRRKTEILNAAG